MSDFNSASRTGLASELMFAAAAIDKGLNVLQPIGNYLPYDLIASNGEQHYKVQVKAANSHIKKHAAGQTYVRHTFNTSKRTKKGARQTTLYTGVEIDFFACHFVGTTDWLIVPVSAIDVTSISFDTNVLAKSTKSKGSRFEKYRNAWHLLTEKINKPRRLK